MPIPPCPKGCRYNQKLFQIMDLGARLPSIKAGNRD